MKPNVIVTPGHPCEVLNALTQATVRTLRSMFWEIAKKCDALGLTVFVEPVSASRKAVLIWRRVNGERPPPGAVLYLDSDMTPECGVTTRYLWIKYVEEK